jgi:hypothetical protein
MLALLLFLLIPCAAVSCDISDNTGPSGPGAIDISYTGAQLATGGRPDIGATGTFAVRPELPERVVETLPVGVQALAVVTALVMAAGMLTVVLRRPTTRAVAAAAIAAAAAMLLVATEVVLIIELVNQARNFVPWLQYLPETQGVDLERRAGEVVEMRVGFWLALAVLIVIAGLNVLACRSRQAVMEPESGPRGDERS